jgi:cell division protein FtsB
MRAAGFDGFERGELGSTKENLTVLKFKVQQEKKRLAEVEKQNEKAAAEAEKLVQATKVRADIFATQTQIANMAKPGKSGNNVIVTNPDWKRVSEMAKRCVLLDEKMKDTEKQIKDLKQDRDKWKRNYERLWDEVKDFIKAIRSIPQKLLAFISEHLPKSHNRDREV